MCSGIQICMNRVALSGEREAMLVLNYGCDKNCVYCFNEPEVFNYKRDTGPLLKDYKAVANKLQALKVTKVYLTGGEPSLRVDLPEIVADLGVFERTITTHGRLFTVYSAEQIRDFGFKGINISVDAFANGDFKQTLRDQDGSFIPALKEFYKDRGSTKVSIITTLSTVTLPHLERFLQMDFISQADRVLFQPLSLPSTNPLRHVTLEALPLEEVKKILEKLKTHVSGEEEIRLNVFEEFYAGNRNLQPCLMGLRYLQVDPDGVVFGCPHNKSKVIAESILDDPIEQIEENLLQAHQNVFSTNSCLESRCLALHSHLTRRYRNGS